MKKIVALIVAAVLLCSCAIALADVPPIPERDTFASMSTVTKNGVIAITLTKPVDKLYVNWPRELTVTELAVTEKLTASAYLFDHTYQPGVAKVVQIYLKNRMIERPVGTNEDRAFVTVQGNWIVCYNRNGDLVAVAYAPTVNIQAVYDVAFQQFGEVSSSRVVYKHFVK